MPFTYSRTIHFRDTDAAGVVYFAEMLNFCHEAYEASLAAAGIDLGAFFGGGAIAVPIVHAEVDFRRPLRCGDRVVIHLQAQATGADGFELQYRLTAEAGKVVATALTRHVSIDAATRQRSPLPPALQSWLQAVAAMADAPAPTSAAPPD